MYAADPWNLANLPRLGGHNGNLLRHVGEHVSGLTAPQLQLGSMFSCRPWHIAPHLLYSLAYLHVGDTKKWYRLAPAWLRYPKAQAPACLLEHHTGFPSYRTL